MSRTTAPSPSPTPIPTPNTTPPRRPRICSTSSRSTAIAPARTSPIRGRCPSPTPSRASSAPWSKPRAPCSTGTRLEDDLADLLWSFVNLFHRKIDRIERELDDNEQAQRRGQGEQDGSEVKSVELERLIAQGISLIERRNAFEFCRDHAAELFEATTGSAWRPRAGSMVNHRALTAAMIDSREFLAARRRADTEVLAPAGTRIAFTGGVDCNDHERIWDALDKVRAKHPDMVLLHGGSPRGAERIAACWADNRKVPQVVFKPDWTRHGKAAPFKRNDQHARSPADRRRRLPRLRHLRQPRRQGQGARHPGLALHRAGPRRQGRRRLGAAFLALRVQFHCSPQVTAAETSGNLVLFGACGRPRRPRLFGKAVV